MSHRRIIALFLAFLSCLAGATCYLLFSSDAATAFVKQLIGKSIARNLFELEWAEINVAEGRLSLRNFQLAHPDAARRDKHLLSVGRVEMKLETDPAAQFGAPLEVAIHQMDCNLSVTRDGAPDFGQIFAATSASDPEKGPMPFPTVRVTDSRLRLQVAPERPSILFDRLELTLQQVGGDPDSILVTGSMRSPMGHKIHIEGTGNRKEQKFRTLVNVADVPIKAEQAAAFQEEARQFLDTAAARGHVEKAQAWLEYEHGATPTPIRGGISMQIRDLDLTLPQLPYPIRRASAEVFASTVDGGSIHFELQHRSPDGAVSATGKILRPLKPDRHINITLGIEDILIGQRVQTAVERSSLSGLQKIQTAFEPSGGRVNARIELSSQAAGSKLRARGNLDFEGVQARFRGFVNQHGEQRGFPYPMQDVAGKVRLEHDSVQFRSLTANDGKGGTIRAQGLVTKLRIPRPHVQIQLSGRGFTFSDEVRQALDHAVENGAAIYDTYSPRGKTDLEVHLREQGSGLEYSVELLPQSAALAYARFPLTFREVTGSVRIHNAATQIDLRGTRGSSQIIAKGRFRNRKNPPTEGLHSSLWIKATGCSFDAGVHEATRHFSPEVGGLWDQLSPRGNFEAELTLSRATGEEEFSYDGQLHLLGASAAVPGSLTPIEEITGDLFFHGEGPSGRCDISPLRAKIPNQDGQPPASLLVQGTLHDISADISADVSANVHGLQLSKSVGQALHHRAIIPQDVWDSLALGGFADVAARLRRGAGDADTSQRFEVRLRGVSSAAKQLPGKARDLRGEIIVDGGVARFAKIEGMIDQARVDILDGKLERGDGETTLHFTISADDFPIDDRIARSLTGPLRQAFLSRQMRGRAKLPHVQVVLQIPDAGGSLQAEFKGAIEARDLRMDVGLPGGQTIQHLTGSISVTRGSANAAGGQMAGNLHDARFELSNHQIHGINCDFTIDPEKLSLYGLTFQTAGGTIRGGSPTDSRCFEYRFTESGRIYAYLNYQNLRLQQLLKNEALAHSKVRGICNGKVIIHQLDGGDFLDMHASGDIGVHDGKLGTVPLFSAIYRHLKEDKRPQFTMGRVEFSMKQRKILLRKFNVRSDLIKVEGEGSLSMDGYMDIDLNVPRLFGSAADILILPPLLNEVFSKIVRFKVYGYIRDPKIDHLMPFSPGFPRQSLAPIPPVPVASGARRSSS